MARKRKSKKTYRRRRSSMSGTGGDITTALSMVAGAVIGRVVSSKFTTVNPKILAGGQIALGYFLPKMVKNKFVQGIGTGMVVNGGVQALQSFGVISAISGLGADVQVDYLGEDLDEMSGSSTIPEIAGIDEMDEMGLVDQGIMSGSSDISIIAGMDDYDY